jgi:hypothetical protein
LGLKHPTRVAASGPTPDERLTPQSFSSRLEFPADGRRDAVTLHWSQAKGGPEILKQHNLKASGMNNLFIGSEGMMLCGFDNIELLPTEKFRHLLSAPPATAPTKGKTDATPRGLEIAKLAERLPASPGFHNEWLNACRGEEAASCNFGYSGPMTEAVLLANLAYRAQTEFAWDAAHLKADNATVDAMLRPTFRKGWEIG